MKTELAMDIAREIVSPLTVAKEETFSSLNYTESGNALGFSSTMAYYCELEQEYRTAHRTTILAFCPNGINSRHCACNRL